MARLIYSALASLDGYVADESGNFDWAAPDEEVHAFVNELERPIGTYLYGRRMYEVMIYWETAGRAAGEHPVARDFAEIWRAAEKVVYSRTLEETASAKTRVEREFDPEAIRRLLAAAERDVTVGGPELAVQAFAAGLVDECRLFLAPVVVGAGKRALPQGVFTELELLEQRRFAGGMVTSVTESETRGRAGGAPRSAAGRPWRASSAARSHRAGRPWCRSAGRR